MEHRAVNRTKASKPENWCRPPQLASLLFMVDTPIRSQCARTQSSHVAWIGVCEKLTWRTIYKRILVHITVVKRTLFGRWLIYIIPSAFFHSVGLSWHSCLTNEGFVWIVVVSNPFSQTTVDEDVKSSDVKSLQKQYTSHINLTYFRVVLVSQ